MTTSALKDELLAEVRSKRGFFYNTVVAQAQRIEVTEERITFSFLPVHVKLRELFEQQRGWLEEAAQRLSGRKMTVSAVQADSASGPGEAPSAPPAASTETSTASTAGADAKQDVMATPVMRDLLDVFPAEIRNIEEL